MDAIAKGALIAHYRILEPLGAGGMGAVYKALDEKLGRIVALKMLPPDAVADRDKRRRFLQEARAASSLNHPHILTVFEIGESDGKPYMAMEYIEGETLRQKIDACSLSIAQALDIAIQIADGLSKAHEHGIAHRDLKPENLIVSRDGYAKILDFGLAKLVERQLAQFTANSTEKTILQVRTESGTIMGTINYMSPEQLLGQRADLRSDIFSFGIVLYEILTGRCPFRNENRIDTMHAILHEEPASPHVIKSDLPLEVERILQRALRKSPKERYQQIREMATDLRALRRDLEMGRVARAPVKTRLVLKRVASVPRGIDYEKELNASQYRAVTTTDGPLLIVAGAGTGKTRTLVYRVARLVESNVKPESILLLSFTRRAATSMLARAANLADHRCQRVSGGTFHSLAHSVLRKYSEEARVARTFTVLDQSDTEDLIDLLRRQMKLSGKERRLPRKRTINSIFSMSVNKLLPLKEVLKNYYPQFVEESAALENLHGAFEAFKRERHLLSYDDLLVRLRETLEEHPELCARLSEQYRYIMVDEYQDTNRLQAQIMRLLAATHDNVAVVGDECQSIYSFRGASFRNMLEFPELFPAAEVIKLEENFRSTQPILDVANSIISEARESYAKRLYSGMAEGETPVLVGASDEHEQSRFICERIDELRDEGVPLSEMAVLFRASSHSFDLEIELARHGIAFRKFGGIKFTESAHIKDALSFLRVVVNPSDTLSWFRMLKLIDHIGDATVEQILDYLNVERRDFKTARAREILFNRLRQFPARTSYQDQLTKLAYVLHTINEDKSPPTQLSAVLRLYRPILRARYDDHPRRTRDLEHLQQIAKRYKTTAELLADVAMDPNEMAQGERGARNSGGYLTLSTVHSAKGLEWRALFIIWMMDGWFPSSRSTDEFEDLEEERRLLYVAATRAKEQLYFIYPENAYNRAEPGVLPTVSRFLEPIPHTILQRATLAGTD